MAIVKFEVEGKEIPTYTLTHLDWAKVIKFMESKKRRPTGLIRYSEAGTTATLNFKNNANSRGALNIIRRQVMKEAAE